MSQLWLAQLGAIWIVSKKLPFYPGIIIELWGHILPFLTIYIQTRQIGGKQLKVCRYYANQRDVLLIAFLDNLNTMAGLASTSLKIYVSCDDAAKLVKTPDGKGVIFSK